MSEWGVCGKETGETDFRPKRVQLILFPKTLHWTLFRVKRQVSRLKRVILLFEII